MADDPVTPGKLTSQSANSFGHIAKTSHNKTFQLTFDEDKPWRRLGKVVEATFKRFRDINH